MATTFVVAFGPNQSYCLSNRRKSIWNNVPQELGKLLQHDPRFRPEMVLSVSLGPNSAYFIKSKEAYGWSDVSQGVVSFVKDLGGWNCVQWIKFASDPEACLILNTNGQVFGRKLSQGFHDAILRYALYGFKDICLGVNDGFALSTNNNLLSYKNMPEAFLEAWKRGNVAQMATSAFDQFFFVEYNDGTSVYLCPPRWHDAINELRNVSPRTSSGSSTSSNHGTQTNLALSSEAESAHHRMVTQALPSMTGDNYIYSRKK